MNERARRIESLFLEAVELAPDERDDEKNGDERAEDGSEDDTSDDDENNGAFVKLKKGEPVPWRWCSPETASKRIYGFASDVWMVRAMRGSNPPS